MKKAWRFFYIGIAVILISASFAVLPVAAGDTEANNMPVLEFPRNEMAPDGLDPMDLTAEDLGEKEIAIRELAAEWASTSDTARSPAPFLSRACCSPSGYGPDTVSDSPSTIKRLVRHPCRALRCLAQCDRGPCPSRYG